MHARSFFERALALDLGNLDALIGTAQVDATLGAAHLSDDRVKSLAEVEATLRKELLLASNNPIAHEFMGLLQLQTRRATQAVAELERSLALNPNLADARAHISLAKLLTVAVRKPRVTRKRRSGSRHAIIAHGSGCIFLALPRCILAMTKMR